MQRELSKKYFVYYQKCKKTFSSTNHSFTKQEKSIARHFNKHGIAHYQDAMNEKIAASFLKKNKRRRTEL